MKEFEFLTKYKTVQNYDRVLSSFFGSSRMRIEANNGEDAQGEGKEGRLRVLHVKHERRLHRLLLRSREDNLGEQEV